MTKFQKTLVSVSLGSLMVASISCLAAYARETGNDTTKILFVCVALAALSLYTFICSVLWTE